MCDPLERPVKAPATFLIRKTPNVPATNRARNSRGSFCARQTTTLVLRKERASLHLLVRVPVVSVGALLSSFN
ncbi:hypothetical protein Q5P01_024307 [Channa striata]|uniref:Uncharacterized protein n=1 Tax=Channa striata TaxID=64152 RepID=A0AA88IRD8_CHASR|nr:hypothetical protein Q5P01_024307 [Channa striata]